MLLLLLLACHKPSPDTGDTAPLPEERVRTGSFALLSDIHIGDGSDDFGTQGWDDAPGDDDAATVTLQDAVARVNGAVEEWDLRFVAVTGDLTDSGEVSEMTRARDVLDGLAVPWVPLLGNHDLWPYAVDVDGAAVEAPDARGDTQLREILASNLETLPTVLDAWVEAPGPVTDPDTGASLHPMSFLFEACGWNLFALDLNNRVHEEERGPGAGPQGDLHDWEGGTWRWFESQVMALSSPSHALIMAHHPFMVIPHMGFTDEELDRVAATLEALPDGVTVPAAFGGHLHMEYERDDILPATSVVVVDATLGGDAPRVVQLYSDGTLDWTGRL